jgi:hypothetical protein
MVCASTRSHPSPTWTSKRRMVFFSVPVIHSIARTALPSHGRFRQRSARSRGQAHFAKGALRALPERRAAGEAAVALVAFAGPSKLLTSLSLTGGTRNAHGTRSLRSSGRARGIISSAGDHPGLRSLGGCRQDRGAARTAVRPASLHFEVQPPPRARFPVRSPTHPGRRALLFLPLAPVGPAASARGYVPPHCGLQLFHVGDPTDDNARCQRPSGDFL